MSERKLTSKMLKLLKKRWFYYCLIIFPIVHFCIFYIGINANSIVLAFTKYDVYTGQNSFHGFENFKQLITDIGEMKIFTYAFKNSVILYLLTLLVGVPLSLLFSHYIYKKWKMSKFFQVILYLPSIVSAIGFVLIYKYTVEKGIPEIYYLMTGKRMKGYLSNVDTEFAAIMFYNLWTGFGVNVIMYSNAMANISESIIDASKIDGVNSIQEFFHIVLPRIYSTITVFVISGVSVLFTNQMNLMNFKGAGAEASINTMGYYLYAEMVRSSTSPAKYPYLAALGLLLTFITVPVAYGIKWSLNKFGPKDY